MSLKGFTVVCATSQIWHYLDQATKSSCHHKNVSQAYHATLHETKLAHITFKTSFEKQKNTKANHIHRNKEEEVNVFAWQYNEEGKINFLQEV